MRRCLEVRTVRNHRVVSIVGDLDHAVADDVRSTLERQIAAGAAVVVDCSGVEFVDSRGLSALICGRYSAWGAAVSFQLQHIPASMRGVLRAAGIDGLFAELESPLTAEGC